MATSKIEHLIKIAADDECYSYDIAEGVDIDSDDYKCADDVA